MESSSHNRPSNSEKYLLKHQFYAAFAEELIAFSDEEVTNTYTEELCIPTCEIDSVTEEEVQEEHDVHLASYDWRDDSNKRPHCAVCKMEHNLAVKANGGKWVSTNSRNHRALAFCKICGIYAHTTKNTTSKMNEIPELNGMTCFDILHSHSCKGLWDMNTKRRTVSTKHQVYNKLLQLYDIPVKKGSRLGKRKDLNA